MGLSVLQARITVRWKRGLTFRAYPTWLEWMLLYTTSVDAEGLA